MRFALLFTVLVASGCMTFSSTAEWPTRDPDEDLVQNAIKAVAEPSFNRTLQGRSWVPHQWSWGSHSSGREHDWSTVFACRKSADFPKDEVWPLPTSDYSPVLDPVRADVLAAVKKTGVEVCWAPAVEFTNEPNPEAKFVILYLRMNRKIAGEVVGHVAPTKRGPDTRYAELRVTLNEWGTH